MSNSDSDYNPNEDSDNSDSDQDTALFKRKRESMRIKISNKKPKRNGKEKMPASSSSNQEQEYDLAFQDILKTVPLRRIRTRSLANYTEEQIIKLQKEEEKIRQLSYNIGLPTREKILLSDMPIIAKSKCLEKLTMLNNISSMSSEYQKLYKWINGVMRIPFEKYQEPPVYWNEGESITVVSNYLKKCKKILNDAVYGMEDAKIEILQLIAQNITKPQSLGNIIVLEGAPGTGKTSIIREGLAKALGRPISCCALGGATDASFFKGHGYTYEGSTNGKIVDMLVQTQKSNCIFYFDELDKISNRNNDISGILTHILDPSQNFEFEDRYYSQIPIDLSKVLFICSVNDSSKINNIVRDRMKIIKIKGYSVEDKMIISKKYLLPKIYKEVGILPNDINFNDEVLEIIIRWSFRDKGVRMLRQDLKTIVLKLNTLRFINDVPYSYKNRIVKFPVTIDLTMLEYLKKGPSRYSNMTLLTVEQQKTIESEENKIDIRKQNVSESLQNNILLLPIEEGIKSMLISKYKIYNEMDETNSEKNKMKQWFENILKLPFISKKPSKMSNQNLLKKTKDSLDKCVYGMENVKLFLLNFVVQRMTNPYSSPPILCLVGEPGTGKTKILQDGLADALNLPFGKISLGGMKDSSILEGHSFTYVGSKPGKIVELLQKFQVNNGLICLDEIDKLSGTNNSVIGCLLSILDITQNSKFEDRYLSGINIDLSKITWVCTANKVENIDVTLRDRMNIIMLEGYTKKDKKNIIHNFILPKIKKELKIKDLKIDKESIKYVINSSISSKGVRQLEKDIAILVRTWLRLKVSDKNISKTINLNNTREWLKDSSNNISNPPPMLYS